MSPLVLSMALRQARKAAEHQLKARGHRLSDYPARALTRIAERYLSDNYERLMEEALAFVLQSPALRALYEKDLAKRAKRAERNSQHIDRNGGPEKSAA